MIARSADRQRNGRLAEPWCWCVRAGCLSRGPGNKSPGAAGVVERRSGTWRRLTGRVGNAAQSYRAAFHTGSPFVSDKTRRAAVKWTSKFKDCRLQSLAPSGIYR